MAIILRRDKGSTLTHDEMDNNFSELLISNIDSAGVIQLIDSAYVQERVVLRDSSFVTDIIDSAYVRLRADSAYIKSVTGIDADTLDGEHGTHYLDYNNFTNTPTIPSFGTDYVDSAATTTLIQQEVDSTYVQARQIKYTTADFPDSAFVTGLNVSTFTNDVKYLDSGTVTGVINSSYVNSVVTGALITGSGIGGGVNTTPLTHPIGSYMPLKVRASVVDTYNTGATYPGIFPGDTVSGSNLYYANGFGGYSNAYPAGIYNSVSVGTGTWKALAYLSETHVQGSIKIGGTDYDAAQGILYQRVA